MDDGTSAREGPDEVDRDWVRIMADLEDLHGGFPGFTGRPRVPCPVCGMLVLCVADHALSQRDDAHVVLSVLGA